MKKDMIINLGGAFAIGALIFGVGLMAIGSKKAPADSAPVIEGEDPKIAEAKSEEAADKAKAKPESEKKEGAEKGGEKADEKKGEEKKDGEKKDEKKEEKKEEKKAEEKRPSPEELKKIEDEKKKEKAKDLDEVQQLQLRYNDLYTRGNYDDARMIAMKAMNLMGRDDTMWIKQLADATYQAEALPAQLRFQKAFDSYASLLTSNLSAADKEWAQYRAGLCLTHLGRWEDAQQSMDVFVKTFPKSDRIQEVRLMRAQSMFALGRRDEARDELEHLVKNPAPRDVHATALVELARVELDRAKREDTKGLVRAEVLDLNELAPEKPVAHDKPSMSKETPVEKPNVPDDQWASVRRAVEKGNLAEAQRLINPWVSDASGLSSEERARVSLKYAEMIRLVAQSRSKEERK